MPINPVNKISFRALTSGLGRTLFLSLLCFSLIPLFISGWVNYQKAAGSLYEKETEALEVALQLRAFNLNSFFQERVNDLKLIANEENNILLLSRLATAFSSSQRPLNQFVRSYDHVRLGAQFGADARAFLDISGDHDLLLVDARGNVLYSVAAEADLGTNLVTAVDAAKNTELTRAFQAAMKTGQPAFSDMTTYQYSDNQNYIFGANMVVDENGEKIGAIILQIPFSSLNNIMIDTTGLGETGQIFLLGRDGTLRSTLRNDPTKKILFDRNDDNPLGAAWIADKGIRDQESQAGSSEEEHETYQSESYGGAGGDNQILTITTNLFQLEKLGIHWLAVAEINSSEVYSAAKAILQTILVFLCVTAGLVILFGMALTRRMIGPLSQLTAWAGEVSCGDLRVQDISAPANEIGTLNEALKNMVYSLRKMDTERDEQDWIKTGIAQVSTLLQGEQELTVLGRSVLSSLASYLDLQVGTLFIADDDKLRLLAGYAYQPRRNTQSSFKWGEGVIGQAALDQKTIYLNDVPDEHVNLEINTGLAASAPRTILIVPLLHEGKVQGVIEFGAFHPISARDIYLIEKSASSIAVAIHSALARAKLALLLEQSQAQTEELASQQEELRQANDSLERQTKVLRASEENLQAQQEELRLTNEELEEQTQLLEEQKQALNAQNFELDNARKAVEQKAEEIAVASRYKSEFLANMSHELRTPLNSILLLSKHLANNNDENLTKKQIECATTVHSSGNELLNLINEVLDLAKVESGKMNLLPEDCYIEDLTAAMDRTFRPLTDSKGLEFSIQVAANMPKTFHTDCQRLAQIVKNLLANACKFTENGSVILELSMGEGALPVTFKVKDTGIGIAADKIDTIFQAFQQEDGSASRKYGGTGLGLSISRELAALLGGKLEAESVVGKGSTFSLSLPEKIAGRQEEAAVETTSVAAADKRETVNNEDEKLSVASEPLAEDGEYIPDDRKEISKESRSILIIEDDPVFARILRDTAREKGFMTLVAESGETGLHLTSLHRPDGIILDMGLPGMDGKTVLFRLKDNLETRHIPVHIISATDKDLEPMHMGAVGYLTKPVTMESMNGAFNRIEKVLAKEVKKVLLVEDNQAMQQEVAELIGNGVVKTTTAATGAEAKTLLENGDFDCMILDLGLPDMSGHELLKDLNRDNDFQTPVIIHTARELTAEERQALDSLADSIIVKDVRSMDKLLDESNLFLHRVAADLPDIKKEMIRRLHDREAILENKKVLIVDDDMRNVFSLVSILEEKGINTIVAENGKVALAKLEDNPDIHLVLMDIMMPEMDGYEAMEKIRALESRVNKIPIIALTAKAMKGDRAKCIEFGASDYLSKPVDADKLFSMLRVWLY